MFGARPLLEPSLSWLPAGLDASSSEEFTVSLMNWEKSPVCPKTLNVLHDIDLVGKSTLTNKRVFFWSPDLSTYHKTKQKQVTESWFETKQQPPRLKNETSTDVPKTAILGLPTKVSQSP